MDWLRPGDAMIVTIWKVVAGMCLLTVAGMYLWLLFHGPKSGPPWWFI